MFLTQLRIEENSRSAKRLLLSPQSLHAAVMSACTGHETTTITDLQSGRVLWRVDEGKFGMILYVVSPKKPDMNSLANQLCPKSQYSRTANYDPFLDRLTNGQLWNFRLTVNPTHSVSVNSEQRGKRYGHVTVDQQARWLLDRAEKNGFSITTSDDLAEENETDTFAFKLVSRKRINFKKNDKAGLAHTVTMNQATFEGSLSVTDASLLREALTTGIGPSKAYGCGLLTLARAD